ncbi:hypothetical protein P168DRAFT_286477 [Aspergillus campestris IBT 28561]|uniref:Uncharacterized protein n=1 Tax=Aspergillus campestris (strain IBT 28561) TaxID=1392248 RepID=A0A2I1DER9_ASPC2|nr:uncharacterized protein P168DRAFT_286477 [Aspergillus campestris IBT 28561]PKY08351.1 hypothetical protein P168DRAFT_286477 [Aspergillus campestris IBT 28561]
MSTALFRKFLILSTPLFAVFMLVRCTEYWFPVLYIHSTVTNSSYSHLHDQNGCRDNMINGAGASMVHCNINVLVIGAGFVGICLHSTPSVEKRRAKSEDCRSRGVYQTRIDSYHKGGALSIVIISQIIGEDGGK